MGPEILALEIIILIFSVIIHEIMHGLMALKFGDHTAQRAGRLTLNPISHIDPIGTILIPALFILPALLSGFSPRFIIGWAKPVPINPFNFSDIKRGELFVSAAGVGANFIIAILAAIFFHLTQSVSNFAIQSLLIFTFNINLILTIFNLLPIPPLDGSKVLLSFLPLKLSIRYREMEKYGIFILLLLLFIPIGSTTLLGLILGFFLSFFHNIFQIPY